MNVWAIGTKGIPASPAYAADRHRAIRETLCGLFGCAEGQEIPILYGGSVNQENACGFLQLENVDGCSLAEAPGKPIAFLKLSKWPAESPVY